MSPEGTAYAVPAGATGVWATEAGKVAIIPNGSLMITHFAANAKFPYAWIPLPKGPLESLVGLG